MKIIKKILIGVLTIIILGACLYGYLKFTGKDQKTLIVISSYLLSPKEPFNPDKMHKQPNYSDTNNWLSLPSRNDEADLVPINVRESINDGSAPVDVFYIHGTGYTSNRSWTSPIAANTATEDNAKFSLANEASIFNGCCNIYAPHYREASIFAYFALDRVERDKLLDAVYKDISSAFEYYVNYYNQNRPIVIVGHSQGTHLAMRLLREIDLSEDIAERLVVAYLIGSGPVSLTSSYVDSLRSFNICGNAVDTRCVVHWNTYGENGTEKLFSSPEPSLCINPLNWSYGNDIAPAELNLGSVSVSGAYTMRMEGDDYSDNVVFSAHNSPMVGYTWAQCRDSYLYVENQSGTEYEKLGKLPDQSYHGIDLPLFHMNIRENVSSRISKYFTSMHEN